MSLPLVNRFRAAWTTLVRGAVFPFNRVYREQTGREELRRPFNRSPWVMRAIKIISGPIAAVPLRFTFDGRNGEQEVQNPQLDDFWANPAKGLTFYDFVEATVGWLKLRGEAFWVLGDEWLLPFPRRFEPFMVVRPDRMTPVLEEQRLVAWALRDSFGRRHTLLPQQVIHIRNWNPSDDIRGASEYEAAECAAEADYLACLYNRNLMQNNGDQGPIIVGKSGIPTDDQRQQIIEQLREKRARAQQGIFAPIFLTGDISVEDPMIRAPDASFVQQRLHNRHEVFIAFGVPPSMADIVASYSVGSASDRFRLIEDTCMPLGEKIADHVQILARRMVAADLFAWFDWDEHSVMQQVRGERIDAARKLWDMGMPLSEINGYLRMGMKPFDGWDTGYLPFSVAPIGEGFNPTSSPDFGEPPFLEDQDEDEASPIDQIVGEVRRSWKTKAGETQEGEEFQKERPKREISQWQSHMAARQQIIRAYISRWRRVVDQARKETLANLERLDRERAPVSRAAAGDLVFNREGFLANLLFQMRRVAGNALKKAGDQVWEELGRDDPFSVPDPEVERFHRTRQNKINGAGQQVFNQVRDQLEESITAGESLEEMTDRVRGVFNDISRRHAQTIALTETAAAYGQGRQFAMNQAGVQKKMWLTSGNDNVRPAHRAANRQVVPVTEPYTVGGEKLLHPGDPNGSPENVINCHCVSIAVGDDE